jgi:thioredoxin 1
MINRFILSASLLLAVFTTNAQTVLDTGDFEKKLTSAKQPQLIDVRTPGEFKDGHLQNSKNIDYKSQDFKDQIAKLDKDKPVFVYCLGGVRSAAAAEVLHQNGFSEIYDMKGGYLKWTLAGKPVIAPEKKAAKGMSLSDFNKLTSSEPLVLIDFYAPWCGPCVKMLPTIHKLTDEYKGKVKISTIHYDENNALAKELGIDEIPAFLMYQNGKLVKRTNGLIEEAGFRKMLNEYLK